MNDSTVLDTTAGDFSAVNHSGLAPYATKWGESHGRLFPEEEARTRSGFQRDRDRIIHSTAFRRLEYKTQVFVNHEGDHFRTRLTHSLEVAQLARSMARELAVDEDLAEALALAHDLGHTPFGHAGEDALDAAMQDYGGFDHNAHTIRILTQIEQLYAEFDGLNLSWETLEGIAKHNGPLLKGKNAQADALPRSLRAYNQVHNLELHSWPGIEAQISALADDIAYHNHDIDDGLRAGLFTIEDLHSLPLVGDIFYDVSERYPNIHDNRLIHEVTRRVISLMVADVVQETRRRLALHGCKSADDIRSLGEAAVAFSPAMNRQNIAIKAFLMENMYRHYKVNRMTSKARRVVKGLFELFLNEPECMPAEWRNGPARSDNTAIAAADYIAGMTDRYAMQEYTRLFDMSATHL